MNHRRNVVFFIVAVSLLLAGTALSTIYGLYRRTLRAQNLQLRATVRAQARLINTIGRHSAMRGPEQWRQEAMAAIADSYRDFSGAAPSAETVLARLEDGKLITLLRFRGGAPADRETLSVDEAWAPPYRRAAAGDTGVFTGVDPSGRRVVAGYARVPVLDAVLISQVDVADLRHPYERAALQSALISLLVIILAMLLFSGVIWPMVREVEGARDRFRQVVESSPSGFIMADDKGRILMVNKMAEELFGYSPEEFLRLSVEDLIPQRYRGGHAAHRRSYHAAPERRPMGGNRELFARRKDGGEFPVEIGLNPIVGAEGRFVLAAVVDISDRRRLQHRLAQKEALAAVGEMAAVVAHEIRNPLGSIVTSARSIAAGDLDEADRNTLLGVLASETERLNKTITDFLQYARPRDIKRREADLAKLVAEVLASARAEAEVARGVEIEEDLDADLRGLSFDPDQMRQVVWNLLLNAIEAAGRGGRVAVRLSRDGGDGVLRVGDSGPGVPAEARQRIFKPFFTTKEKGSGLGLATSARIVGEHGGRLELTDSPLGGAEFVVFIPF